MIKKIVAVAILLSLVACESALNSETKKTLKAGSASGRINSSSENNKDVFKDLE